MPGLSLTVSGKSMLKALLAVCLYLNLIVFVDTFFNVSCFTYSVPGTQCLHSRESAHSSPNLRLGVSQSCRTLD
ncbi:hypothetical protein V8C86DRAFT_2535775 [Haematococcus lacustris]